MDRKMAKPIAAFATIAIIAAIAVFVGISATQNRGKTTQQVNAEDAMETVNKMVERSITVETAEPVKSPVNLLDGTNPADELPTLTDDAIAAKGHGDIEITVFASPEKAGTGNDAWMADMAKTFNRERREIDGKVVSVTVYNVTSGLGFDYILTETKVPTLYAPSNPYWGRMLEANNVKLELIEESTAGNVAGIVLKNEKQKEITEKYGAVNVQTVTKAVAAGELMFGYTTPNTSSTGQNYIMEALSAYDPDDPLSQTAIEGFRSFQENVPFVANVTMQMSKAAEKGVLDGFVFESQVWENTPSLHKTYTFTPYGIRHDNPVYATEDCTDEQKKAARLFLDYCKTEESMGLAKRYGFGSMDGYKPEYTDYDGETLLAAQSMWKENKDSGRDIVAVFVADVSGSMDGEAINMLKESLVNGMAYINENNRVGLVSYSTNVTKCCPIAPFDLNQKSLFKGAVESLTARGSTGTCNGLLVGMQMVMEELQKTPDAKPMLFLLSDGDSDHGYDLSDVKPLLEQTGIPVYTISYNDGSKLMDRLSEINEAATVNATSDDVTYKIRNLFNSNL